MLAAWPIDMPANWLERVNQTDDAQELEALRRSVQRVRPFGQPEWQKEVAKRLGLESASRPTGRRERWAEIKMPRPGEDRSDVGGAAQFDNIGPVPLSRFRFPASLPLSRFAFPLSAFEGNVTASQQRVLPFSDIVAGLAHDLSAPKE